MQSSRLAPACAIVLFATTCVPEKEPEEIEVVTGQVVPSGFVEEVFAQGLTNPTAMEFAPDGRLFVAQQNGQLRVIQSNGSLLATPFVSLTVSSSGERGLLGVTFHPSFASNQFVYVYYTATSPAIHNRVSRFTANGNVAVAGSEVQILNLENLSSATNHNGGAIHFGPDGMLYVAVGENANRDFAQSFSTRLGKMLRVTATGGIPSDNPFLSSTTGVNQAIWARGLRNPFTFSFQPGTGRMFINDVGEVNWEEINDGIRGSNYGWPMSEGFTNVTSGIRAPLLAYGHGTGASTGCAITGGAFYNPPSPTFPSSFVGRYFFADFCSNWIRVFNPADGTSAAFATGVSGPVDLKVHTDGSLYYLARGVGRVGRIRPATANQAPQITSQPQSLTRSVGQSATFSVTATGTAPLSFQWQRNGVNITGATASSFTISSVTTGDNNASFRVIVRNSVGMVTSAAATLTVTTNQPPTATINTPAANSLYNAGTTISFSGSGNDPEGGALPASAFTWRVEFGHDTHFHPHMADTSGITSGTFAIPNRGELATNVFYRIFLTVRDSAGLTGTTFRDIRPRVSTLTVQTNPTGLQVTRDAQAATAPTSFSSVVGMIRLIGAPLSQTSGGTNFNFVSWSDGGAATHEITTPATATTFTATYTSGGTATTFNSDLSVRHATPLCMDVPNSSTATGTRLIQWTCHGGLNQSFTFEPIAGVANTFRIRNRSNNLCVDINGGSTLDNAAVIQWTCGSGNNQRFTLAPASGFGSTKDFTVRAVHSGKCVAAPNATQGTQLVQLPCGTTGNFVWRINGRP
jgi:glucose/arabinose dehydrogenase